MSRSQVPAQLPPNQVRTDKLFITSESAPSARVWGDPSWMWKDYGYEGAVVNYVNISVFCFSLIPNINHFNSFSTLYYKGSKRKYFIIEVITFK